MELPPAVGEGFARLYGSDERPETAAEWVANIREAIERTRDRSPTVDDLCTVDDGDHAFVGADGTQTYICVLDPLVYPFLTGESGTVRSTTPVRGTEVSFEMDPDGPTVSHDDALVSIGVSDDVEQDDETPIEAVYQEVCGYIQTFEDAAEYDEWAAEVDASTTAVPADEGVAIARSSGRTLRCGRHSGRR
ncbi:organomercurial lyase [Halosimplex aquaticum]